MRVGRRGMLLFRESRSEAYSLILGNSEDLLSKEVLMMQGRTEFSLLDIIAGRECSFSKRF